ncbi:hypothetical protein MU582_06560 [Nocardioidaceae bacterium SCSIO 66511]|nr:hypothetical protein MU582_06560 [Nocardioidaceae bacterium SCSIO 66511]
MAGRKLGRGFGDCRGRVHPQRFQQFRLEHLRVRVAGDGLDDGAEHQEVGRGVRVLADRARVLERFNGTPDRPGLVVVPVSGRDAVGSGEPGRVRQQLLDRRIAFRKEVDVIAHVVAQGELSLAFQLHHDRCGHRLRDRADQERRVLIDLVAVSVDATRVLVLDSLGTDDRRRDTRDVVLVGVCVQIVVDVVESPLLGCLCRHHRQSNERGDQYRQHGYLPHSKPPKTVRPYRFR